MRLIVKVEDAYSGYERNREPVRYFVSSGLETWQPLFVLMDINRHLIDGECFSTASRISSSKRRQHYLFENPRKTIDI